MSLEHIFVYLGTLAIFIIGALSIVVLFLVLFVFFLPLIQIGQRRRETKGHIQAAEPGEPRWPWIEDVPDEARG